LDRIVTVCNKCGAEMPEEGSTFGDACLVCGEGAYSMHEDALSLEINKLQARQDARDQSDPGTALAYEVDVAESAPAILGDTAVQA
jgi:hypothetical protein